MNFTNLIIKPLKELNSSDITPGFTKFMTLYIMPLMIVASGYGFWYVGELLNSTLSDFENVNATVGRIELKKRSNHKLKETIYTDLYLTTNKGLLVRKKNISEYSADRISNDLSVADKVEIFYDQQTRIIKELRKSNEPIISFQSELETHRKGRIAIAVIFFGFLFWYLSRMYRYRKYGTF